MRKAYELPPILAPDNTPVVASTTGLGTGGASVQTSDSSGYGDVFVYIGSGAASSGSVVLNFPNASPPQMFVSGDQAFGTITSNLNGQILTISWTGAFYLRKNSRVHVLHYEWFDANGVNPTPVSASYSFTSNAQTDPTMAKLGEWALQTYSARAAALGQVGDYSYLEFVATGTKLTANLNGDMGNSKISIDGGAFTPVAVPAGWSTVTLFDGLNNGPHRVRFSGVTGGGTTCIIDATTAFTIYGFGTPNLARPADIMNYWPIGLAPYTTYGSQDGSPVLAGGFGTYSSPYRYNLGTAFGYRFQSSTPSVQVYAFGTGQTIVIEQDGAAINSVLIPNDNTWLVRTLAVGLSGTHEYNVYTINTQVNSVYFAIMTETINNVAHANLPLDAYYGDSIVVEQVTDARQGDAYLLAHSLGRAAQRLGTGGARLYTFGRDNTALVTGLAQTPTRVFEQFGVNDMAAYTGAGDIVTFQAACVTMLQNLRAGLPLAKIYCRGIFNTTTVVGNSAQRPNYNAAKAAAVASLGDANIVYINTDGWIDPTAGVDTFDGLHPNFSGYTKIANAQALVL